jgi:hypothetical protein
VYIENPVVVKATVTFKQDLVVKDYTAKLVKTLLIAGNPELGEVFNRSSSIPKPLHITPLYTYRQGRGGGKLESVYAKLISRDSDARPPSVDRIKPVRLKAGWEYFFYVGANSSLASSVLLALSNVDRFVFGNELVGIDKLQYEVEYVDVEREAKGIRGFLESPGEGCVKVVFASPTLLKDPLAVSRQRKKKVFMPLPEAVLSTPIYMLLADTGRLRQSVFRRLTLYVKSVLDTPYTALKSVNIVWYVYDNKPLPALIGYVKYYLDADALCKAQRVMEAKHRLDFTDILAKAITLARIYGVGDGRATGFGHTSILISPQQPSQHISSKGKLQRGLSTNGSPADGGPMAGKLSP